MGVCGTGMVPRNKSVRRGEAFDATTEEQERPSALRLTMGDTGYLEHVN